MKKILIGICATTLLAASAASFAGTLTYVNRTNTPITFVVQPGNGTEGSIWNSWQFWNWNTRYDYYGSGTVLPGQTTTVQTPGPLPSGTLFSAFPTDRTYYASNCGMLTHVSDSAFVVAGYKTYNENIGGYPYTEVGGKFGCRGFVGPYMTHQPVAVVRPVVVYPRHHHHRHVHVVYTY
ncbi:MAG: hypothetical protein JSR33_01190 [Proteobacteria bacterium]|nr:hypothetical protein [Pseudomonadota bacterium]